LHRLVNRFLDDATVLAWDAQAAAEHAKVRHTLRQRGQTIYHYDEMIAGHALALGAVLVTNNTKDFRRVDTLLLEDWTQPTR
jgi:tRNA(fMet)-specific endonuclease VapC